MTDSFTAVVSTPYHVHCTTVTGGQGVFNSSTVEEQGRIVEWCARVPITLTASTVME
jgi:hypothetical protein